MGSVGQSDRATKVSAGLLIREASPLIEFKQFFTHEGFGDGLGLTTRAEKAELLRDRDLSSDMQTVRLLRTTHVGCGDGFGVGCGDGFGVGWGDGFGVG